MHVARMFCYFKLQSAHNGGLTRIYERLHLEAALAWHCCKVLDNWRCLGTISHQWFSDKTDFLHRVFHLRFNEKEMVQEIYFLRQLSHDEAARKVGFSVWGRALDGLLQRICSLCMA